FLLTALGRSATGSSNRVCRALLLVDPPSLDRGEMTDKGSINQRAVLTHRAGLVDELYAETPSARVIVAEERTRDGRPTRRTWCHVLRCGPARRRAHAVRRLQRRARVRLADRSRHQSGARAVQSHS